MVRVIAGALSLLFAATGAMAQPAPAALVREIAPGGTLRAAINYNNPLLARRDPTTGAMTGVAVDLSNELGRRLGVPVELVPYTAAGAISAAVSTGAWDIAYLAIDPARANEIDFTAAYLEIEGTYLVPPGSPLATVDDVDREGVRIAVTAKSAYDLFLSRTLTHATLVYAPSTPESIDLFTSQRLEAVAAVRTALVAASAQMPGSRVMAGHFMTIPQAAGVPKGRSAGARYVRDFIERVKASGFVADALARHGLEGEALVAAPAPVQ